MCDTMTEPGMNHIFFSCCEMFKKTKKQKTKQNKYLHQHTYFSYFPNPLRLGNLYFLYVTLDLSTLHARYYTHPNTPQHNNTAMLRHTHTNFHTVLKEKHFLFCFLFPRYLHKKVWHKRCSTDSDETTVWETRTYFQPQLHL